jgi:trehalose utilization protein
VVVWDERQPAQKQAYENFLGNQLADHLRSVKGPGGAPEFEVTSVGLDDPDQGLSKATLDHCDVLIWWGHQRHGDVNDALVKDIVQRIQAGQLSLLALHSAHFSKPFIEAMNARTLQDAMQSLSPSERNSIKIVVLPADRRLMGKDERLTPYRTRKTAPDGTQILEVKPPGCAFTDVRADGKPSHLRVLVKNHPITRGIPETFNIPQTEMYNGPFHVPTPDVTLFEEKWDGGEQFLSGSIWSLGAGKVFYFRPGHETFPIFKQPVPLKIVENAARWLGTHTKGR